MKKNLLFGIFMFAAANLFAQASIDNPYFDRVNFRGAFGSTDWTAGWTNFDPKSTNYPATTTVIQAGDITTNTTWTKNNVYLLNGWVYVKDGVTLTIEAGTIIRGDKTNKGSLIIERGAKLVANGTAAEPIVFTSNQSGTDRTYGDWGGIVICGKAPINQPGGTATIEGGVGAIYGGGLTPNAADNSGSLQFVRIEFSGIAFQPNSEINGLTLGGVGSGTTLNNIQISYCGDDSFEWFGGTVNAKYLIAFRGWDDDFDTDNGFSGMVQFAVSLRDPQVADQSTSNGFESDNDSSGSENSPFTSAIFSNVSVFGPLSTPSVVANTRYGRAAHYRRNIKMQFYNMVYAGWATGLLIDGNTTQTNASNHSLRVRNSVVAGMNTPLDVPALQTWTRQSITDWYNTAAFNNIIMASNADLGIVDAFNLLSPKFTLTAGSVLHTGSYWALTGIFTPNSTSAHKLTIYPNPATTEVILELPEFSGFASIQITDLAGRTMISKSVKSVEMEALNIADLRSGMYLIVARQGNNSYSQKLTVR